VPGLAILRPESGLFFANADRVREAIRSAARGAGIQAVVVDLGAVPDVDLRAARMLGELADDLSRGGQTLAFAHDIGQVRDVLRAGGLAAASVYATIDDAVEAAQAAGNGSDHDPSYGREH
jgi:sulfate permease, SulP family